MPNPSRPRSNRSIARKQSATSSTTRRSLRMKAFDVQWNGCERCTKLTREKPSSLRPFEGRSVLVTGGAGAIGGNLVAALGDLSVEQIIVLDNLSSAFEWNIPKGPRVEFVRGDVLDDDTLKAVFEE